MAAMDFDDAASWVKADEVVEMDGKGRDEGERGDRGETEGTLLSCTPDARRPGGEGYTAFVLSGGGAMGAIQVGALLALLERGERPDVIVGTSIGAWNGAWLARTPTLAGVEALAEAWRAVHTARVLLARERPMAGPAQALSGLLMLAAAQRVTLGYPSLYSSAGVRGLLEQHLGNDAFEDMELPLRVIATNITRGTREIFTSGPLVPAVLASSAIPGVFPPVRIGKDLYVDGGALDNCSIDTALRLGARRIFVIDVGYDRDGEGDDLWPAMLEAKGERISGLSVHALVAVLARTGQIISHYQLSQALERLPQGVEAHVIRLSNGGSGSALDFANVGAWIEHGYTSAGAYLRTAEPIVGTADSWYGAWLPEATSA